MFSRPLEPIIMQGTPLGDGDNISQPMIAIDKFTQNIALSRIACKNHASVNYIHSFFYKNKVYKNIQAENGKILRIC